MFRKEENILIFPIFGTYVEFCSFFIQFWCIFSLNWLRRELSIVCWHMFYISYGSRDKLNLNPNSKISTFLFLIKSKCRFLQNDYFMGYSWTINIFCYFISKRSLKVAHLEGIFNTWNSKTRQMSWIHSLTVFIIDPDI